MQKCQANDDSKIDEKNFAQHAIIERAQDRQGDTDMDSGLHLKILTLLLALLKFPAHTTLPWGCPEYCKCDLYEGKNRADCSGKRLINAYVDLAVGVQVLDLSYNDIAIIDEGSFQSHYFLINLTITHNDIHTIYLDAFVNLPRLRAVDLAYNRLEYLDERLFETNRHFEYLNLEGNKFMSLPSRPFLRSPSLRTLNLRDCGIDHIPVELFTALPQLTELNLSQNLMITLNASMFNALKRLKSLQLDENAWNCDKALVKVLSIVRHRGVNVSIAECDEAYNEWKQKLPVRGHTPPHMFERMQHLPMTTSSNDDTRTEDEQQSTALNWRNLSGEDSEDSDDTDSDMVDFASYLEKENRNSGETETRLSLLGITVDEKLCEGSAENLCRRYRNCLEQVSHALIKQLEESDRKGLEYTQSDLNFAFLLGIAVGVTGVVFLITCALCLKSCLEVKKFKHTAEREGVYDTIVPVESRSTADYFQSERRELPNVDAPIRRPRRARRPQSHAIVRRGDPGPDSFIARLLGRPARRNYYQVGTATLIRCLSRTSLFNNNNSNTLRRQSSSQADAPGNQSTNNASEVAPLNLERPETPPPNYGDIVGKK